MKKTFIIYGAYGYTGELVVEEAAAKGLKPILSGRNEAKLKVLGDKFGFEYIAADLDNLNKLDEATTKSSLILNCAGPFSRTFEKVVTYCLKKHLHYTDITGEIQVFEMAAHMDKLAKENNIMILPGTGFDVVPSDCLAAFLKQQMPKAQKLALAFKSTGGLSHGTATTMVENIGEGGAVRIDGKIEKVKAAYKTHMIDYGKGPRLSTTIPWGDVSTAYYSTGIPNIEVYMFTPSSMLRSMKMTRFIGGILSIPFVNNIIKGGIKPGGPNEQVRTNGSCALFGEVEDENGNKKAARLETIEGYTLTAKTAVLIAEKILAGNFKTGFATPSLAYGADLIMEIEGSKRNIVE